VSIRDSKGFTLIELLIVVVIIGILAAIAIPRFASTKEKAFDAAAKTDLRNAMSSEEGFFADSQTYATFSVAAGGSTTSPVSFQASKGVAVSFTGGTSTYTGTAKHSASPTTFCVNSAVGVIKKGTTC